jgi:DNA-binding protein
MAKKIKQTESKKESNADDVTVYIGDKDELAYVKACLFILKRSNTCGIKARYSKFTKALDVYFEVIDIIGNASDKEVINSVSLWTTPYTKKGREYISKEMLITIMVNHSNKVAKVVEKVEKSE